MLAISFFEKLAYFGLVLYAKRPACHTVSISGNSAQIAEKKMGRFGGAVQQDLVDSASLLYQCVILSPQKASLLRLVAPIELLL